MSGSQLQQLTHAASLYSTLRTSPEGFESLLLLRKGESTSPNVFSESERMCFGGAHERCSGLGCTEVRKRGDERKGSALW